jgi:hypothetical protein
MSAAPANLVVLHEHHFRRVEHVGYSNGLSSPSVAGSTAILRASAGSIELEDVESRREARSS